MANNRMFLVHRPTGLAVFLGKRMAWGWYMGREDSDVNPGIANLFKEVSKADYDGSQDDFCIVLENAEGAPFAIGDWKYMPGQSRDDGVLEMILEGDES